MALVRQKIAIAAIVVGSVLAVAGMALTMNAIWVVTQPVASDQLFDTYYVLPSAWITLLVFGVGAIGNFAFRRQATRFGGRAALIWRTHLAFTTALMVAWLIAGTQAEMTRQVVIVVYATCPLMLFEHGTALATGAMIVRGVGKQADRT